MTNIKWPFGALKTVALSATGAQAITITGQMTVIDGVTTQATANRTINLTIKDNVEAGALIFIKNKTNGTETTTYGTGITSAVTTGEAGKTITQLFVYDGTAFLAAGAQQKID